MFVVYYYIKVHAEVKLKVHCWEEGRHLHLCAPGVDDSGPRIIQPKFIQVFAQFRDEHFKIKHFKGMNI